MSLHSVFVPPQATSANLNYFDVWNVAGNGTNIELLSVVATPQLSTAIVGLIGIDLYLTRTTSVGTGGTAATYDGVALNAMTISSYYSSPLAVGAVSARFTPGGGAATGAVLEFASLFTEETQASPPQEMVDSTFGGIIVRPGTGFKVIQGATASPLGSIGFNIVFRLV
jgi:hypothetical protein